MTKDEAITVIKAYRDNLTNSASNQLDGDIEAFEMAIKALEQEPYDFARWVAREIFDDEWEYNKDAFAEIACRKLAKLGIVRAKGDEWELVEQEPCDTCEHSDEIDGSNCYECVKGIRDRYNPQLCGDAISREMALKECHDIVLDGERYRVIQEETLLGLPPVNPQPKTEWIPVSGGLPKIADVYRVTRCFPNNVMNPNYLVDACFFDGSNTWYNDNRINHERAYVNNVIAWQENPEPYEPQERKVRNKE